MLILGQHFQVATLFSCYETKLCGFSVGSRYIYIYSNIPYKKKMPTTEERQKICRFVFKSRFLHGTN